MNLAVRLTLVLGFAGAAIPTALTTQVAVAADAAKPLGDLSQFITVAKDAQKLAKGGDFATARTKLKDLEKIWDDGEDQYRPNNSDGWRDADRKIDKALDKLRDVKPAADQVNGALDTLVTTLESLHKPK